MSVEAIEIITKAEMQSKESKTAAEIKAKELIAEAQRSGLAFLEETRTQAAVEGKALIEAAEGRAQTRCTQIQEETRVECDKLCAGAQAHVSEAVERIVGKVVIR